nr:protection of telomeres protein 1-like [Haemonchus contortus]
MAEAPLYEYTALQNLPDSGRVNVYGVVLSVTTPIFGGLVIEIKDEHATVCLKVSKESEEHFKDLRPNDVLRLHRAEIGSYRNEKALIVNIGAYGCHAVAWSCMSDTPTLKTSKTYTFDDQDAARLSELREWSGNEETRAEAQVSSPTSGCVNAEAEMLPTGEANVDSPTKRKNAKRKKCNTVESASEIPSLGTKFFNWYCEVLAVYEGKGEPLMVFVRAWDGTLASFSDDLNMFRADAESIETTFCETSSSVLAAVDAYTFDVCCYGDWAAQASKLKVGDIVYFSNIRNYLCKSRNCSALTMHEGGASFDRALSVIDENDPIHFEISRRCAESLAELLASDSTLIAAVSGMNLTPIIADDVVAQSTPIADKEIEQSSAVAAASNGGDPEEIAPDMSSGVTEEHQPAAVVAINGSLCAEEDKDNCIPEDILEQFLQEAKAILRQYEMDMLLRELSEPKTLQYSLTDEMEAILEMDVGRSVRFLNFVEAELSKLKNGEYLRHAVVFTEVCVECGEENIVERGSRSWCLRCFGERKALCPTVYSYRIPMPVVYSRRNEQQADLTLLIAAHLWTSVRGGAELMLVSNVLRLFTETSKSRFIRRLNSIFRFAEAVMTKRKVSHVHGKILKLNRETGSIVLFVDQCIFADKGTSNEIFF